jgi:fructoselysine 6-kinase
MSGPKLIAAGDNCLDVYLTKNRMAVGGNALNVAVQWARRGLDARYVGVVGRDEEGDHILGAIGQAGLDPAIVERRDGHTAVTLLLEQNGDRRFLLEDLGVGLHYMPDAPRMQALRGADWVHLGTNSGEELVKAALASNLPFSVDISTAHDDLPLAGIPLVFASGPEDPSERVYDLLARFRAKGAARVVVTCGKRGAFYDDGVTVHEVRAQEVDVVDTCGAGDSFIASFILDHMVMGLSVSDALARATAEAARTCTYEGGFPQELSPIPDWLPRKYSEVIASAGQ